MRMWIQFYLNSRVDFMKKMLYNFSEAVDWKSKSDLNRHVAGDPGLGKSQLLQAAAAVSPRGIYVCGNATTNAGLTVAVVKDPMTNDYAFEAGMWKSSSILFLILFVLYLVW